MVREQATFFQVVEFLGCNLKEIVLFFATVLGSMDLSPDFFLEKRSCLPKCVYFNALETHRIFREYANLHYLIEKNSGLR